MQPTNERVNSDNPLIHGCLWIISLNLSESKTQRQSSCINFSWNAEKKSEKIFGSDWKSNKAQIGAT